MIKHVVMWKLSDAAEGNSKAVNLSMVKEKLLGLKQIISEIESLEVGENINSSGAAYDMVLITTHADMQALAQYIDHPAHKEVASFIGKVISERKVVDFEYA
jgi:Trk K+ transport system NAD-binding subunit